MLPKMREVHALQILNHYTPREELDPGFEVLDNSANERPDWYEYWPIRNYLLGGTLDEDAFYGFLSPKFKHKTNLDAGEVYELIRNSPPGTDVVLLSPSIHTSAYYLNVFEHGDSEHPGLLHAADEFFRRIGRPTRLDQLITDSRNTVHSNYFIARPRFWRAWLAVTEQIYAFAESAQDPLGSLLRAPTHYRGSLGVQMKIFLMERVATWILCTDAGFQAYARDPFAARARIYKLPLALICDALKIAYATERRGQYKDVFTFVSSLRRYCNLLIRLGDAFGVPPVHRCLRELKSYWSHRRRLSG
jgi:hypothetical protein